LLNNLFQSQGVFVKRKNVFPLGMLAMVLVFGFAGMGCAQLAGAAITGATQSSQNKRLNSAIAHAINEIGKVLGKC
jgi:hypothetical protein